MIEAGLGGRLDATNVIPSKLTVLTSVGSTTPSGWARPWRRSPRRSWRCSATTRHWSVGEVPEEVNEVIDREVTEKHAKKVRTTRAASHMVPGYQGENLALAEAAARVVLGDVRPDVLVAFVKRLVSRDFSIPGRAELVLGDPPADLRRRPQPRRSEGACGRAPGTRRRPRGGLLSRHPRGQGRRRNRRRPRAGLCAIRLHRDSTRGRSRDRAGPVAEPAPRSRSAALCRKAGREAEAISNPHEAWDRARDLARERDGVALAAGSHYLLSSIWTERPAQSS